MRVRHALTRSSAPSTLKMSTASCALRRPARRAGVAASPADPRPRRRNRHPPRPARRLDRSGQYRRRPPRLRPRRPGSGVSAKARFHCRPADWRVAQPTACGFHRCARDWRTQLGQRKVHAIVAGIDGVRAFEFGHRAVHVTGPARRARRRRLIRGTREMRFGHGAPAPPTAAHRPPGRPLHHDEKP